VSRRERGSGSPQETPTLPSGTLSRTILAASRTLRSPPTCDSALVGETKTYTVSFVSKHPSHAVDEFYKYRGEHLPEEGEIVEVVRFLRGRAIRARVTRVDAKSNPQIAATEIA